MRGGTPVAPDIVVDDRIEFNTIKGDGLLAEGNFSQEGAQLGVELVAVHARVRWRVADTQQTGLYHWRKTRERLRPSPRCVLLFVLHALPVGFLPHSDGAPVHFPYKSETNVRPVAVVR